MAEQDAGAQLPPRVSDSLLIGSLIFSVPATLAVGRQWLSFCVRPNECDDFSINNTTIKEPMTTKPKTANKKNPSVSLCDEAFQKENLSLQKKVAKLGAQLCTANTRLKIQEPIIRAAQKKPAQHEKLQRLADEAVQNLAGQDHWSEQPPRLSVSMLWGFHRFFVSATLAPGGCR